MITKEKLAMDGGAPKRTDPLPGWPIFAEDEINAAKAVLESGKVNYWTGDQCQQLEQEFAACTGTRFALSLANGTLALELALWALDIQAGDEVIVPSCTFIATASAVIARGAYPVIADVDRYSQTIQVETIRPLLGARTKAIIAVHLAGWPCDMDAIMELAAGSNLKVIEDCAQAHGASWRGRPVGGLGHIGVFSFCHDKIMTFAGEGGMLVTNDEEIWLRAWSLKDHGKNYQMARTREPAPGFRWLHERFGSNYRLSEIQAAVGRRQLLKLNQWSHQRRANAVLLNRELAALPALHLVEPPDHLLHGCYKHYVFLRDEHLKPGWDKQRIIQAVSAEGIPIFSGICSEIYREKAFAAFPRIHSLRLENAMNITRTALMFQVHPSLTPQDLISVAGAVKKVLAHGTLE